MPDRPDWLTESEHRELLGRARDTVACIREPSDRLLAMVAAGIWLGHTVRAAGADVEASKRLVQAFAQACYPARDPLATAQAILARWRAGRGPEPGGPWALELLQGDVSDLPKGGMRIVHRAEAPDA
jgi:hypothetical protein